MKKEIRIKSVLVRKFPFIKIEWFDGHTQEVDLSEYLKKPMFLSINQSNFNTITVVYDGCAVGWPAIDVEIGFLRFVEEEQKVA